MKKEAQPLARPVHTVHAILILVVLLVIVAFVGCQQQDGILETNITNEYYDPFVIDQAALPRPLPPKENGLETAHAFAAAWNTKNYSTMYDLIDPFLQEYKSKEKFIAMMKMNPRKYGVDSVEVKEVAVLNHYQGKAVFVLYKKSGQREASELMMDLTFDQNEQARVYGFVDFFNTPTFYYVCGDVFNSSRSVDIRHRQHCLYELAYLSQSKDVCETLPQVIFDHGECFNVREDAGEFNNLCDFYATCFGVVAHVTGNESLCNFPYPVDVRRCSDGKAIARQMEENKSLNPTYVIS
ncbi:hypothetical protein HYS47_00995 [Candidatus Woesearchaeota archaeon]|nr:hypothetical protein [Candidatus Woesearchaeota archaeon]